MEGNMDEYTDLITTRLQLINNLKTLENYRNSSQGSYRQFYDELIENGICFVICTCNDKYFIGPSKFVGHIKNDSKTYKATTGIRSGIATNEAIIELLGDLIEAGNDGYNEMENIYRDLCVVNEILYNPAGFRGHKRKYWLAECSREEAAIF